MNLEMVEIAGGLLVAVGYCLQPLFIGSVEDEGDGRTTVHIPPYMRTPARRPRTWGFYGVSALLTAIFIGLEAPAASAFAALVGRLAVQLSDDPTGVAGFVTRLHPASQVLVVSYIVGLAVVARASLGRRVAIAAHVALYIVMTALAQALMIAIGLATGWPVGPFAIEATLVNLLVGGLVVLRVTWTTFILPKPTVVPNRRPRWLWDSILTWCAIIVVIAVLVVCYAFLSQPQEAESVLRVLVPMYALTVTFLLLFVPLALLGRLDRFLPLPGDDRPPVDVIVPAYNEEDNLARLIRSIDVAAQRYGGRVRLVVSNDGSVDTTEEIARQEIARLRFVQGEILSAPNGGQAAALNRGLAITDAEICVRIDADCVMGRDALVFSVPWFRDPYIGTVGAMMMPRTDTVTWFHRLRALETLFQFRFVRRAQSAVDAILVIPGTFTAFRRQPAMAAGGFPTGMNGEDADLTMQIGRLGYRGVVDPRVTSFEDVPRSAEEFLEQRTRWARAGIHVFARHNPFCVGSAGPRVWFWTLRRSFSWFSIQAGLVAPIYIGQLTLTHPTYRRTIVTVAVLYLLAGALAAVVALPLAVRYRQWRSILWMPTWFVYAFLRRLAMLEAVVSLPTRPLLAGLAARRLPQRRPGLLTLQPTSTRDRPAVRVDGQ
jgi:cellulose synthase/poly-beta-1,6-N-acetylglucosamine synthase-like glycosyltransferase